MPHKRYSAMQVCETFFTNNSHSVALSDFLLPEIPGLIYVKEQASDVYFNDSIQQDSKASSKSASRLTFRVNHDLCRSILPGLPDDVAKHCLALVPRSCVPFMGAVSRRWRSFIRSKEFMTVRRLAGVVEEWVYILVVNADGNGSHWEVQDCLGEQHHQLPPMPGPVKNGFNVVGLNGKLLVIGGNFIKNCTSTASADVYQYDSSLNRFDKRI
ncbi:hypothetical protein LIER_34301 [Lithospermum erythrorhizon]|uniref:F-box domain-containing protein n=1 Tax=Lithospermum erythrorhizon TaxID=34254 RepID=A0AAV3S0Z4_LITER